MVLSLPCIVYFGEDEKTNAEEEKTSHTISIEVHGVGVLQFALPVYEEKIRSY